MTDLNKFFDDGFLLKKKLFDQKTCEKTIKYLESRKPSLNIPFSNVGWGYGNLIDEKKMDHIIKNNYILEFCNSLFGENFIFNHLMINNKAPWIGPDVEWHQEVFNIDTYAPGGNNNVDSWTNYLQIYIALDPHTLENGCLKVIPNSHKLGLLPHEDIVNSFFNHKRRIPFEVMNQIYKTNGIKNLIMESGDVLFFNHRFIHGSASNNSPFNRRSIVLQARKPIERDLNKFEKETHYRKNFTIDFLKNKLEKLVGKNIYNSFKRKN